MSKPPAPLRTLHQRAYEVAGIVCDCRYIASTLCDVVPESIHHISIDDLGRLQGLASAVDRLAVRTARLFAQVRTSAVLCGF